MGSRARGKQLVRLGTSVLTAGGIAATSVIGLNAYGAIEQAKAVSAAKAAATAASKRAAEEAASKAKAAAAAAAAARARAAAAAAAKAVAEKKAAEGQGPGSGPSDGGGTSRGEREGQGGSGQRRRRGSRRQHRGSGRQHRGSGIDTGVLLQRGQLGKRRLPDRVLRVLIGFIARRILGPRAGAARRQTCRVRTGSTTVAIAPPVGPFRNVASPPAASTSARTSASPRPLP